MANFAAGVGGPLPVHANLGGGGAGLSVGDLGFGLGLGGNGGAGLGVNTNGDASADSSSGVGVNLGGGAGAGAPGGGGGASVNVGGDNGGGVGVGLGGGAGGLFHLGGAADASGGPPCTVQGGPARLIYFPPPGAGGQVDSTGAAITHDSGGPAAVETPIAAWGNTFNPDYCYLSVETLYATLAPSGTISEASTVGPTFTNAIFPFRSSEISTLCQSSTSTSAQNADATSWSNSWSSSSGSLGGQVDFGGLSATNGQDSACREIVAPPRFGAVVPEWSGGLFWNMNFEAPVLLTGNVANGPPPSGGQPCSGCPASPASQASANTPAPTICTAGWNQIPGGPPGNQVVTPSTAPAGVTPSSFGQYTAQQTSNVGAVGTTPPPYSSGAPYSTGVPYGSTTGVGAGAGAGLPPNATATGTSPASYTGAAANVPPVLDAGRSVGAMIVGVLLFSLGLM